MADLDSPETGSENIQSSPAPISPTMTLQKAVDLGEYDPNYLKAFPEWQTLSRHVQFQFIRQGLKNRNSQLFQEYASICNILNFSQKPHLQEALKNIEAQRGKLLTDEERLFEEYSKP